jgi:uncharacterized protein (TIGR00106 family)
MKAIAYVSITPIGKGESVSEYVARAVRVIKESGLSFELTPMGTIIAGDSVMEIFDVINDAIEALEDCNRLSISIKIDYRRNREGELKDKVISVTKKL